MLLVLGSDTPISSHGQAEPTAAEGCSPHAHTDLHLVVLHTSTSQGGFTKGCNVFPDWYLKTFTISYK